MEGCVDATANIAIGYICATTLQSGQNNCLIGVGAAPVMTNSSNNTCLGSSSLGSYSTSGISTSGRNVAIGALTGSGLESGLLNTYLGYAAGSQHTADETGNICINNQGVIGDNFFARSGEVNVILESVMAGDFKTLEGRTYNTTTETTTYAVTKGDHVIFVDSSAGAFTVTLPAAPVVGKIYIVKDSAGQASPNAVTIAGNGKTDRWFSLIRL